MAKSSVKRNFFYQMIYEVLIIILPFITSPYLARVIGAEGQGIYSYHYSVAYYFVLFSMLGLKNYGNRAIAQVRDNKEELNRVFSSILLVHVFFSVIFSLAYIGYCFTLKEDRNYALIQVFYVLSAIFDIGWFFFGIEKFKLTVTRNTIIKIITVILVFIFVRKSNDLWKYCLIMSLGMLISQLTLWIPLRKYVKIVKPEFPEIAVHIKPLFILFIPAVAVSLYKFMDKIMIGDLSTKIQLGYYDNAEKVINIPMTIISSFGTVMLPKMSNLATKSDKKEASRYMMISMQFVMCLAFALAFGLSGVGTVFAPIFWGEKFIVSGEIIMGLAVTIPFLSFANVIRTQYLIPNEKDKEYILSVILGAVTNLICNFCLIPSRGAFGATIGTIMAEIVVCVVQSISVRRELPLLSYIKNFIFFLLPGTLMFFVIYYMGNSLKTSILTLVMQIAAGILIYCSIALVYFIATKNKIVTDMLNKFIKHRK